MYQKQLLNANALDFDDLLLIPHKLFSTNKEVLAKRQEKFDYIMVDEAQDTNQIQFDLMLMLSGKCHNVTLIGDDYQSIYRRRGAVMENFLNVKKYRDNIQIFKLQTNYRSRPHIVAAGQHLIAHNTNQYEKNIVAHREGNDTIKLFIYGDEYEEARNIIKLIQKIKTDKAASWSDFAILYRMNSQSQVFEQMLVQEGIPYKIFGGFKFFDRKEIKDIISYVKCLSNTDDDMAVERIINTPSRKLGKTTIGKLKDYAREHQYSLYQVIQQIESSPIDINNGTKKTIKQFAHLLAFWSAGIASMKPAELIQKIVNDIQYHNYLRKDNTEAEADEKYANIGQLINFAQKFETKGQDGIQGFLEDIALLSDPNESADGQQDSVKLMTIHASKGLEFNAISIVGAEENIFPMSRAAFDSGELEEERRLMYVAITRAKNHLFISRATSRMRR
jgi:DNA helicase II / ATP-dependent DNA helicase PcrA